MIVRGLLLMLIPLLLVNDAQTQTAARVPRLGGQVIALNTPDQRAVLLVDVTLGFMRRLSLGTGAHTVWGFMPDGCRVLLTVDNRLLTMDLQGGTVETLLDGGTTRLYEPTVSSAGSVAYTQIITADDERTSLIMQLPMGAAAPIAVSVSGDEATPRWSPDGEWLAYVSYEQRAAGAGLFATALPTTEATTNEPSVLLREADLWVVRADGTQKIRLTDFPTGSVSMPRWSPDGTLLSFVYSPAGNQDTLWVIANSANAIPTQLSYEYVMILDSTWLPTGTHLIASVMGLQGIAENRLWQIPLVGRADTDAFQYPAALTLPNADYPRFSADGTRLALRSAYEAILIDTATTAQTRISGARVAGNTPLFWSPASFGGEEQCP